MPTIPPRLAAVPVVQTAVVVIVALRLIRFAAIICAAFPDQSVVATPQLVVVRHKYVTKMEHAVPPLMFVVHQGVVHETRK